MGAARAHALRVHPLQTHALWRVLCPKLGLLPDRTIDGRPVLLHLVTATAAPVAASRLDRLAVQNAVPGRLDIPERVGAGPGTCHAEPTCVRDPAPGGPLGRSPGHSSVPGCGPTSGRLHSTPAACIRDGQKKFCCVTTRRPNLGLIWGLRRNSGTLTARILTAHTLRRGVLGLDGIVLTPSRLPLRRLPTAELPQAFPVLTVTLVPTPWLIPAPTALAQAHPSPRSSRTRRTLWCKMATFHGSANSQGTARGEYFSPRAPITTDQRSACSPIYTSK